LTTGSVRFNHEDLLNLGSGNDKHWFDLVKAKSGEIQLQFSVTMPEVRSSLTIIFYTALIKSPRFV